MESCPGCGAIYAKVEAAQRTKQAQAPALPANLETWARGPAAITQPEQTVGVIDADRRHMTHLVYLLYVLPTGVSTLMAYSIARSLRDDDRDELAAAHNVWQYETLAKIIWVFAAAVVVALVIGAAQAGYLLTHDASLYRFAQRGGRLVLAAGGALYLWTLLRSLRGWSNLMRSEGP
jgi:uncharacterized membrane protein